ncbi:hypothetical protein F0562_022829 [Nyssa sinensis]|uniref:Uncharacterized protein n=1 Tax=Nyssa sinensis TaxID=561372 RepID=A0A5J5BIN7_9ASTE|nr:hypothetical protein F0562_022829 [Nyssa sinensis]
MNHYKQRYEIVNGVVKVGGVSGEATMNQEEDKATEEKGVPDFWLFAMMTNEILAEEISERDEEALKDITDDDEPILEKAIGMEIEWYPVSSTSSTLDGFLANRMILTENSAEELQNQLEQDYAIGSTSQDKIIPHAVSWFTGEATARVDKFEDTKDEDDDDDREDEDEDDEDEEDGKSKSKSKKKKSGRAQDGEGQQGEQPPECQ